MKILADLSAPLLSSRCRFSFVLCTSPGVLSPHGAERRTLCGTFSAFRINKLGGRAGARGSRAGAATGETIAGKRERDTHRRRMYNGAEEDRRLTGGLACNASIESGNQDYACTRTQRRRELENEYLMGFESNRPERGCCAAIDPKVSHRLIHACPAEPSNQRKQKTRGRGPPFSRISWRTGNKARETVKDRKASNGKGEW